MSAQDALQALCDIKQTEPVNSNTANLCCGLLLFLENVM